MNKAQKPEVIAETKPEVSKWETITELSDGSLLVQAVNIQGPPGTGRADCLLRFVDPVSKQIIGIPTILDHKYVNQGVLRG